MGHHVADILVIGFGLFGIWVGIDAIRRGLKSGTFYDKFGVAYQGLRTEEPVHFWCNLALRTLLIPGGIWFICEGVSKLVE